MPKWAVIDRYGRSNKPTVPTGCEVIDVASFSTRTDSREWFIVRCETSAAVDLLRQQEDDWPVDHGWAPGEAGYDPTNPGGCGAPKSVVATYRRRNGRVKWTCRSCGQSWTYPTAEWESGVILYSTKSEAASEINDHSLASFLGLS